MAWSKEHRDWRLPEISPVDVRAVGLDQLLTRLWLRIAHGNKPLVGRAGTPQTIGEVANLIEHSDRFPGFEPGDDIAEAWLRADLLQPLKRSPEKYTVARPVHALATRLRSSDRQTDDSSASLAVYAWLESVDKPLIRELRRFIEVEATDSEVDLPTFGLALLGADQDPDHPRTDSPSEVPTPVCLGQARSYAADLRRLLAYQDVMPRSALIDHIRRLTGFHLGLYLLRVFQVVVEVETDAPDPRMCSRCSRKGTTTATPCPYRLELLVDCGEDARSPVARLAEQAWSIQEDRLARYVRSHLALKRLHEFAANQSDGEQLPHETLEEIAAVERNAPPELLRFYFNQRIDSLASDIGGDSETHMRELEQSFRRMKLSPFRTYIALLAHFSERRWVNYHRYLLDSLFVKNSSEGLLRQPLGGRRRRRAALGPALLETLALIAVVDGKPGDFFTRPLRVDELIARLEERYDLLVARPPATFAADVEANRLMAENVVRFKRRLRETGLFTDLSDAFLAQLVRPRHSLSGAG